MLNIFESMSLIEDDYLYAVPKGTLKKRFTYFLPTFNP